MILSWSKIGLITVCIPFLLNLGFELEPIIPTKVEKGVRKIWKNKKITFKSTDFKHVDQLKIVEILDEGHRIGLLCIKKAKACRVGGCDSGNVLVDESYFQYDGEYEEFQYYFVLDIDLNVVKSAVHYYPGDYGYEITSKWWQKQFIGYQGEDLVYGKNVDAISGATISAQSMCFELEDTYRQVLKIFDKN